MSHEKFFSLSECESSDIEKTNAAHLGGRLKVSVETLSIQQRVRSSERRTVQGGMEPQRKRRQVFSGLETEVMNPGMGPLAVFPVGLVV
jgi:hypothetical protein